MTTVSVDCAVAVSLVVLFVLVACVALYYCRSADRYDMMLPWTRTQLNQRSFYATNPSSGTHFWHISISIRCGQFRDALVVGDPPVHAGLHMHVLNICTFYYDSRRYSYIVRCHYWLYATLISSLMMMISLLWKHAETFELWTSWY